MKTLAALAIMCLLAGCSETAIDGPPDIRFGQDECVHCGMIISDDRCAAAAIVQIDGQRRYALFDDIGDLFEYERSQKDISVLSRYVRDYDSRQWIDAGQAQFVRIPGLATPMGSGLIAYADRGDAEKKIQSSGEGKLVILKALREETGQTVAVEDHACCEKK